ncbi:aldo/keto reductase [Aestuariimicrobium ganziense]|uniref:aldo/keto reductase n=1 Tax=Aestuariimicrobium ganziense TaxID=2773677 RepID=UPI001940E1F1|nr:aldo/keto reductase [Aestuariimicrobium ganziense]
MTQRVQTHTLGRRQLGALLHRHHADLLLGNDTVGRTDVFRIGLGLMTWTQTDEVPRDQLEATVRAALDAGVNLFDTADAYGAAHRNGAKAADRPVAAPSTRPEGALQRGHRHPEADRRLGQGAHGRALER